MKYIFTKTKRPKEVSLNMYLEDVPTLRGSIIGLEELFQGDLYGSVYNIIKEINDVLSGEKEKIESGSNLFWYTITPKESSFECMLEDRDRNFTISTKVLLEIAVAWENKLNEIRKRKNH